MFNPSLTPRALEVGPRRLRTPYIQAMKHVAFSLVCLSLLFAGLDSATSTAQVSHREASGWLFPGAWFSWTAWAVLAWLPVSFVWAIWGRIRPRSERGARRDAAFFSCLVLSAPVVVHLGLDAVLPTGATLGSLLSFGPVLAGLGSLTLSVALAAGLGRWTHLQGGAPLAGAAGLGLVAGMLDFSGADVEAADQGPAADGRPNLMLMVWGSTRAASLSTYGHARDTAPLLAKRSARMAVFEEARAASVSTVASNLSMLTGVHPTERAERSAKGEPERAAVPTLARQLRDAGYRTGAFVGSAELRGDAEVGEGFEVFDDLVDPEFCGTRLWRLVHDAQSLLAGLTPELGGNGRPCWFKDLARPAEEVLPSALDWIENGDPRPWFCMIYLDDAGWPFRPSAAAAVRFVAIYDGSLDGYLFESNAYRRAEGAQGESLEADDLQYLVDLYEAEILELDGKVDAFWEQVEVAGRASGRPLGAIITADHGEAFGEHQVFGHADVQEVQVRVPFILQAPGGELQGRRSGKVSGVDVAPTLLAFAGVDRAPSMGGLDLSSGELSADRVILVEGGAEPGSEEATRAVYRREWKLHLQGSGAEREAMLFNLEVATDAANEMSITYPGVVDELRSELRTRWGVDGGQSER